MLMDGWYRSTLDRGCQHSVDRVSADTQPSVDQYSADTRLSVDRQQAIVGRVSIMYRLTDMSIEVSIATIDRHSIAGFISTHDPLFLYYILIIYCNIFSDLLL